MNVTKLLLATLVGAVVNFLAGWLIYGMLLMDTMKNGMTEAAKAVMKGPGEEIIPLYFVSSVFAALMLAYIYERWAGIRTMVAGATAGTVIFMLMALNIDLGFMAGMNMFNGNSMLIVDVLVYGVFGALTGGAVGWMLGYNRN